MPPVVIGVGQAGNQIGSVVARYTGPFLDVEPGGVGKLSARPVVKPAGYAFIDSEPKVSEAKMAD